MGWLRCQQIDFPGNKIFFSLDFLSEKNENFCSPTSTSNSGGGGQTALTAKLNCTHCSPTPTSDSGGGGRGVRLQSLQSWTALTAAQLPLLILGGVRLQSLQSWTVVTAAQLPLSILGGLDCSHCITKCKFSNSASFP